MIDPDILAAYVAEVKQQREDERLRRNQEAMTNASLAAIADNNRRKAQGSK